MKKLFLIIAVLYCSFASIFASNNEIFDISGNTYKADIGGQGLATAEINFLQNGKYNFTLNYLGMNETTTGTYELHDSNLKMIPDKGGNIINTTIRSDNSFKIVTDDSTIAFVCVSQKNAPTSQYDGFLVDGHTFSGSMGSIGTLTLIFSTYGDYVDVVMNTNKGKQTERWNCVQKGSTINLYEPQQRKISLNIMSNHSLEGMFMIINVNLKLVQ